MYEMLYLGMKYVLPIHVYVYKIFYLGTKSHTCARNFVLGYCFLYILWAFYTELIKQTGLRFFFLDPLNLLFSPGAATVGRAGDPSKEDRGSIPLDESRRPDVDGHGRVQVAVVGGVAELPVICRRVKDLTNGKPGFSTKSPVLDLTSDQS
jgi:hypothetical protein